MNNKTKENQLIIFFIFAYCIFFAVLRLITPHGLNNDEAEQIIHSKLPYLLDYTKQPPLYSWVIKFLSEIFSEMNLYILTAVKYSFALLFFTCIYLSAKKIWNTKIAEIITIAQLLFVTYSYDFNRDLTHSVLVTALASLAFFIYLKLIEEPSWLNYLSLALVFSLGFLSKYNFVFLVISLILGSLCTPKGRKIILSFKAFCSAAFSITLLLPHFNFILNQDSGSLSYAIWRGGFMGGHSKLHIAKISLTAFFEIGLVLFLIYFLFRKSLSMKPKLDTKQELILCTGIASIALPLILIILMQPHSFYSKWLSTIAFVSVFAFFTFIDTNKIQKIPIMLKVVATLIILAVTGISLIGSFAPDLIGGIKKTQYPYLEIAKQLSKRLDTNQLCLLVDDPMLKGNFIYTFDRLKIKAEVKYVKESLENCKDKNKILAWKINRFGKKLPRRFKKNFPEAQVVEPISADMINSKKHIFRLGLAKL